MTTTTAILTGTGPAPLVATRSYTFFTGVDAGRAVLWTPYVQRGPFDDQGVAEFPEQQVFLEGWLAARPCRGTASTEWTFQDADALASAAADLQATLQPAAASPPHGSARLVVTATDARACQNQVSPSFLALVSALSGAPLAGFVSIEDRVNTDDYEPTRRQVWRCGELTVTLEARGIASGHGVHGEEASLTVKGLTRGITTTGYARIDQRSGGEVQVDVRGVCDAQRLAERFVGSLAQATVPRL